MENDQQRAMRYHKARRQKIMYISRDNLQSLIVGINSGKEFFFPTFIDYPEDIMITNVSFDSSCNAIAVCIQSDTFGSALEGQHLEVLNLWQTVVKINKVK